MGRCNPRGYGGTLEATVSSCECIVLLLYAHTRITVLWR